MTNKTEDEEDEDVVYDHGAEDEEDTDVVDDHGCG